VEAALFGAAPGGLPTEMSLGAAWATAGFAAACGAGTGAGFAETETAGLATATLGATGVADAFGTAGSSNLIVVVGMRDAGDFAA